MKKNLNDYQKKLMLDEITFYSLCSDLDKEKILGKVPMSFEDFRRLSLITDYLELTHLHQFINDTHSDKFVDEIEELYQRCEMHDEKIPDMLMETAKWLDEFWKQAPNTTVAYLLHEIFSNGLSKKTTDQ